MKLEELCMKTVRLKFLIVREGLFLNNLNELLISFQVICICCWK